MGGGRRGGRGEEGELAGGGGRRVEEDRAGTEGEADQLVEHEEEAEGAPHVGQVAAGGEVADRRGGGAGDARGGPRVGPAVRSGGGGRPKVPNTWAKWSRA